MSDAIFEKWIHMATFWFQGTYWLSFNGTLRFFLCFFHCSWKWRPKSFIITLWRTSMFLSSIMLRFKVLRTSYVTRSLNYGRFYFFMNLNSRVESSKVNIGNNRLVVKKLWNAWSTSNQHLFNIKITFIFVFVTNYILAFKIIIPHIKFHLLVVGISPMFFLLRRLFGASHLILGFGAILKQKTPCLGRIYYRNGQLPTLHLVGGA